MGGGQENRQDTAENLDGATISAVIYFKEDKLSIPITLSQKLYVLWAGERTFKRVKQKSDHVPLSK